MGAFPPLAETDGMIEAALAETELAERVVCVTQRSAAERRAAWAQALWQDHGALRLWWKNRAQVAPGVWRSNQPGPLDIARFSAMGIQRVVNLRGASDRGPYLYEAAACRAEGLELIDLPLISRKAPDRAMLLALVDLLTELEPPVVLHCKSGADRTGLAVALWRILRQGDNVAEASRALSWLHGHNPRGRAGLMGQILRDYAAQGEAEGMGMRDWAATRYDPEGLPERFQRWLKR